MKNKAFRMLGILLSGILLCLGGCQKEVQNPAEETERSGETWTIGISFPTTALPYRATMKRIVEENYGAGETEVHIVIRDADGNQKKQNQDIMDLVDEGVDGIVLIPLTTEGPISAVQYANDRDIPVITVDNSLESDSGAAVISYVGADHEDMGVQAAELLVEVLEKKFPEKEKWNVIELSGSQGASGTIDREEGIGEILKEESRIHLLGIYEAEFTVANAKSVMDDCLNVFEDIDGVICQNDQMALGCYQSLEEAGMLGEIVVIGIDGERDVVEKIVSGGIDGTVIQYPDMILTGIEKLTAYLQGEEILPVYYQDTDKIRVEDAQDYLDQDLPW